MACTPISSAALAHHPAALGESLLGSSTSLFLLKSPHQHLYSQVLNGVTRPIPQLGFPISKRNLSFSIPFLVYLDQLCCDCSESVCAAQWSLILPWFWDSWRSKCPGALWRLTLEYPGALDQHRVAWLVVAFSALPSALLEICQSEWGFCLHCFLQAVTHTCALFLPHKWVVYVLGENDS